MMAYSDSGCLHVAELLQRRVLLAFADRVFVPCSQTRNNPRFPCWEIRLSGFAQYVRSVREVNEITGLFCGSASEHSGHMENEKPLHPRFQTQRSGA